MSTIDVEKVWVAKASRFLKVELKRANVTCEQLAAKLNKKRRRKTKVLVANKLSRDAFTVTFLPAILPELDISVVNLDAI